ncbi:MAG: HDOD domain-containing protein [Planctomycetes bacterium]|nr:HDOD domain-containing protein [Planctomycetota bacterium]
MRTANIADILTTSQLPALPQTAVRLLELSQDPANGPAEFARPIEADPGLAGQVLRFVNSSYFGFAREISNVKLAIALVGVRTVKNFVLWSAVFSLMPNPKCGRFDLRLFWADSLRRGVFARRAAKRLGLAESEEVFAGALLQDMAIPLLAKELGAEYDAILAARGAGDRLSTLESRAFGWNHADASAWMARKWSLPEGFAELIADHARTDRLMQGQLSPASACVACSALLPASCDERWSDRESFVEALPRVSGVESPQPLDLLREIDAEIQDFANVLRLSHVGPTLESWWKRAAVPDTSRRCQV